MHSRCEITQTKLFISSFTKHSLYFLNYQDENAIKGTTNALKRYREGCKHNIYIAVTGH